MPKQASTNPIAYRSDGLATGKKPLEQQVVENCRSQQHSLSLSPFGTRPNWRKGPPSGWRRNGTAMHRQSEMQSTCFCYAECQAIDGRPRPGPHIERETHIRLNWTTNGIGKLVDALQHSTV